MWCGSGKSGKPLTYWIFSGFSRLFVPSPAALRTSATRFFAGRQFIARVAAHFASLQGPRKLGRWAWLCLMWEGPPKNPPWLIIIFPLKWNFWIILKHRNFEQMHMPDTRGHFHFHQSEMSRSILAGFEDFKTDDMELSMYFYCAGAGALSGQNGILQKQGKRWNARCGQSWHQDFRDFRSRCMELSWNSSLI